MKLEKFTRRSYRTNCGDYVRSNSVRKVARSRGSERCSLEEVFELVTEPSLATLLGLSLLPRACLACDTHWEREVPAALLPCGSARPAGGKEGGGGKERGGGEGLRGRTRVSPRYAEGAVHRLLE